MSYILITMKVREFISPLSRPDLSRLCRIRELPRFGSREDLLERLARSYKGDFNSAIDDLRREDLRSIGNQLEEELGLLEGWHQWRVADLRRALIRQLVGLNESSIESSTHQQVRLYSSCSTGPISGVHQFHIGSLMAEARDARRTTIISAYYGIRTLKKLIGDCRGEVRVVLNGLGGSSLEAQLKVLKKIQRELNNNHCVEIRLGFSKGVFHTKMYYFQKIGNSVVWLGSANATSAGLSEHNEEILVRISPAPSSVDDYAEEMWKLARPLEACHAPVNSLASFFQTGLLYYKPYAQLQRTFNPFGQWMKRLPQEERDKISRLDSDFAEGQGMGAFSFRRAMEVDGEVPLPSSIPGELDRASEDSEKQFRISRFAVETCYGYWVSEKFVGEVDRLLQRQSRTKTNELVSFKDWLERRTGFIVKAYDRYLNDCMHMLEELEVDPKHYRNEKVFAETTRITKVKREVSLLLRKLSDESQIKMHCQSFVPSPVPELWEDASARKNFECTFFESLVESVTTKNRMGSRAILETIGTCETTAKSIRRGLEHSLADPDWYEKVFRPWPRLLGR